MIALRKRHPSLMRRRFLSGNPIDGRGLPDISWHGADGETPDWHDARGQLLAFTLAAVEPDEADLHVIMNMSAEALDMRLPPLGERQWRLAIDTARRSPDDSHPPATQIAVVDQRIAVSARSVVVFEGA